MLIFLIQGPNKTSEAYTEKCAGRRGFADPENWHSRQLRNQKLRSTRGLTPAEVNTEVPVYGKGAEGLRSQKVVACT
jgi:hypothetical protein